MVNVHGPGGIGKTTLLRLFAQTMAPSQCFYFDGHSGFQRPHDFLSKIRHTLLENMLTMPLKDDAVNQNDPAASEITKVIELLNLYAVQQQGVVLFLDTFEQWGAIEYWLRNEFLLKLSPIVKVIVAGRYTLKDQWQRGDWNLLMRDIELQPLSNTEVLNYTNLRGIANRDIADALLRFSNGVPLALSMACEIIERNGQTSFLDHSQQKEMIGYLAMELTKDIGDSLQRYTEAASVVWKFDQELLQTLLQEIIPTERFRDFCLLPFVIRQENSWSLHDSVRHWIYTDFRSRMPQTFHNYRKHALDALRKRELAQPDKKAEFAFEKIYLHEDDFVRGFCFHWDDSLTLRECKAQDLEQVEQLYLKYLHSQSNYVPGEIHLESLIRPLWHIDPTTFTGLWQEKQLVAFCSCIPFTEQTIRIFRDHPTTAPATSQFDPNQRQYIVCIAGVEPELENEISGSVARALIKIIDHQAFILDLISMPNWIPYIPLLGFDRAPWADSVTQMGVEYKGFQLDLRTEDIPLQVDRIISAMEPTKSIMPMEASNLETPLRLPLVEAVKLVQCALKHFSRLPLQPEIAVSLRPLLTDDHSDREAELTAHLIQEKIRTTVQALSQGNKEDQRFYQILHYAYLQKIGTHETVAEYLNIPNPSYFRYLRMAVRKLAYELVNK